MSHAHARNLPHHDPFFPKLDAEELAADIVAWFGECLRFLQSDNWNLAVDCKGKYLRGTSCTTEPAIFAREFGNWSFKLCCLARQLRIPHRCEELTEARERLHKAVTIVIMNLTNSAKAGKMLDQLRDDYELPKLRRVYIM